MNEFLQLLKNPAFLLLLIIVIGTLIGKIEVSSFSFGSSAIIFVALIFGHLGYTLPATFQTLGLTLFIYAIGLQAGPGFINSFRKEGVILTFGALFLVLIGFLVTLGLSILLKYNSSIGAGMFAGALTSTPGLAVAVEITNGTLSAAAYGVTYTFGTLGVILFIKIIPYFFKINIEEEENIIKEEVEAQHPKIIHHHIEVNNPNIFNKQIKEIYINQVASVTITRLQREESQTSELVTAETRIQKSDILRIVGTKEDLQRIELYLGKKITKEIHFSKNLEKQRILVSKKDHVGRTLGSIDFSNSFHVQVSRLTRNGMDLPANANTRIQMGDQLHVIGPKDSISNIVKLLGNNIESTYKTDVFSIILGIFIGFLIGKIPITLPIIGTFYLGVTGGVLITGLTLGHLYKTGPIVWVIPATANSLIRDFGLMLFLATVGTMAGSTIVETIEKEGISLLFSGILVTLIPLILGFLLCKYVLKIRFLRILGVLTGGMTSTPGLASTTNLSNTPYAASAYATVYPIALIGMILFTKVLALLLNILN
ncbi:MAG: putative transport protein [bacterium]|jgi:putative transport protein